ncbi:MAG: hypothetical protein OEQ39_05475 [Gammaproteobacteria bacterium]|nr:hypothetical protein [Gammaproteobacteria bacterium]MDH3465839.1 hypothetical protein [Gammaproteobacteria bacterium]
MPRFRPTTSTRSKPSAPTRPNTATIGLDRARQLISIEAARIMADTGLRDFHSAKEKARTRLDLGHAVGLPSNAEIDDAVADQISIFGSRSSDELKVMGLRQAKELMLFLHCFKPRLSGALSQSAVTPHTPIELHVFAPTLEDLLQFLNQSRVPHEARDKRLRFGGGTERRLPMIGFCFDDVAVELTVFSTQRYQSPPLSPIDGRPMPRLTLRSVDKLLSGFTS